MHSSTLLNILAITAVAQAACIGPPVNQATVDLVAGFEGFRPSVYTDPVGKATIGYGHLCQQKGCAEVQFPKPLSQADGKKLLAQDLGSAQQCITLATKTIVTLNINQYGALVSWAFNVGCGGARSSSLISRLKQGQNPRTVIEQELPQWDKAGGKPIAGLKRRRAAEVNLANTATSQGALPVKC